MNVQRFMSACAATVAVSGCTKAKSGHQAALSHVYEVMGSKGPVTQDDLDDCRANNTPKQLECMTAAKDKDAVGKCYAP